MALSTTIRAGISALMTNTLDHAVASFPLTLAADVSMATGTTTGLADLVWGDQRTLSASATEDLDLAGSLTGVLGGTLTIVKLKAVIVKAASANTNNVRIIRPASNGVPLFAAASDEISVLPGGFFMWCAPGAGITVTAGTGDLITFTNSAGSTSVTYDVVFVGTSA
jgi:hypothetical protein